jgi:hypothetical protein
MPSKWAGQTSSDAPLKIKTTPESSELEARLVERLTQIRRKVLKSSLLGTPLFLIY